MHMWDVGVKMTRIFKIRAQGIGGCVPVIAPKERVSLRSASKIFVLKKTLMYFDLHVYYRSRLKYPIVE